MAHLLPQPVGDAPGQFRDRRRVDPAGVLDGHRELVDHPAGAAAQYDHPVPQPDRLPHVVGDEQDGQLAPGADPVELVVQQVPGHRVQRAERLVHQQHIGFLASARASATRCLMPPDSSCGRFPPKPARFTVSRSSSVRWRRSARPTPPALRASSTLPAAVSQGNRAGSWNMSATRPDTDTSPDVGCSRAATRLSSVDLPQPEAPIRQVNSPGGTSSEIWSSARTAERPRPNTLDTPASRTDPVTPSTAGRSPVTVMALPCLTMKPPAYELTCGSPAAVSAWLSGARSKMPLRLTD